MILSRERQTEIDQKVALLRSQTELSYPKDSLLDIANALGIEVFFTDLPQGTRDVNGIIKWPDGTKAKIILNENYPKTRRTFTLAHELGHFVLHQDSSDGSKFRVDTYDYTQYTRESEEETEANYFAASLLMPKDEFLSVLAGVDGDKRAVAEYFGVSEIAVQKRIKWLETN